MYESLILSIDALQKSKYSKGNRKKLATIQSALKQAQRLFLSKEKADSKSEPIKLVSFRRIELEEQIPKILEEFVNEFEVGCTSNGLSAKNYSLFSITLLKIIKTLDMDRKRGLLSAHAINILDKLFVKHPVHYNKRAIRDPLGLVFGITELAIDAERNLSKPYEFDITIPSQLAPFMQKYHMEFDNALLQILNEFKKMPKFRLGVSIGKRHEEIIKKFLEHGISKLPLEDKIARAKNLLSKIIFEESDVMALEHYNMLKLCYSDKELCPHLVKIAKKMERTNKRFANTILDEASNLKVI